MITRLVYSITFSNKKTLKQDLTFEEGSTLLTGKNGNGKSMNFEMIAYALFGATALRGIASEYKSIDLTLNIRIRGVGYIINRTKTKASVLTENKEPLVSGTSPVNNWVLKTLGYSFDVFKIAHWCAQGDIQALANMRPTERKAMIDSVAGLTHLDNLSKGLKTTIREQKAAITQQEALIAEPIKPTPLDLPTESEIILELKELDADANSLAEASAIRQPMEPVKPIKPIKTAMPEEPVKEVIIQDPPVRPEIPEVVTGDFDTFFNALGAELQKGLDVLTRYEALKKDYNPEATPHKKYKTIEDIEGAWDKYALRQKLDRLESGEEVECPHCKKGFHLDHAEISSLRAMKLPKNEPELTVIEWKALEVQLATNSEYESLAKQVEELGLVQKRDLYQELLGIKPKLAQYQTEVERYNNLVSGAEERFKSAHAKWKIQCANQEAQQGQLMQQYHIAIARYETALETYEDDVKHYQSAQKTLQALVDKYGDNVLQGINDKRETLNTYLSNWRVYQHSVEDYTKRLASYQEHQKVIDKQKLLYTEHVNAYEAIKEIKAQVQNFLIPSLNKVSSYLVYEMTGGALQNIEIQPDFEVLVDGQTMRTLNGSSKDIANLALRIGLGRILTHKVLPLMMLDEIDSAMDEERSKYTWECIQKVTPQIGQVIQASHKELEAETRIEI